MHYDDEYDLEDEAVAGAFDPPHPEEPVTPPERMTLSVQVGLTEYQPHGLLELLARGILKDIGGRDKWAKRLEEHLLGIGEARAEELVTAEVERIFRDGVAGLDFPAIVRKAAEEYMTQRVNSSGEATTYFQKDTPSRFEWWVRKIVKESMDAAWKQAEAEWKAKTTAAIKETLAQAMAERLAKALPTPPEIR